MAAELRLTVLGASPSFPNAGGACSGYLVEDGGTRVLLDCGTGVISNLRLHAGYRYLDAIVISHMHADHFFDLIPLRYGMKYGPLPGGDSKMRLFLPVGGKNILNQATAPFDAGEEFFGEFFEVVECEPRCSLRVGALEITLAPVCHFVTANGIILKGDRVLGYSADTGPCDELRLVAENADLFVCEASLPESYQGGEGWGHMKAGDAGRLAAEAGAKQLLLTHMWDEYMPEESIAAATAAFGHPVQRAHEGMIIEF